MRPIFALTSILVLTGAATATGQTRYARSRDTLRFREISHGTIVLTAPMGEVTMANEHAAVVAVVRFPGDTARAWYDSLVVGMNGPTGNLRPATDSVLHAPFLLTLDARGRARLISAPTFPRSFEGITDLSHQFDDFFIRLPAQPLKVGLSWTDTLTRTDSTAEKFMRWRAIAEYHVRQDTTVVGAAAVIVTMNQQLQSNAEGPIPDQPMRAASILTGTETGSFVFATHAGKLLSRRREGRLEGDLSMSGGGNTMSMKQSYSYTSTLDALP